MVAAKVKRRLGEADRTALIALAGVVCSLGLWALWALVGTLFSGATFTQSLFDPDSSIAAMRLASVVVVMFATLLAQGTYARWFRAEERLRVERSRVEQLYANSPDAMLSLTPAYAIGHANPVAASLMIHPLDASEAICHKALWDLDEPCPGCPMDSVLEFKTRTERSLFDASRARDRWYEHVMYPVLTPHGDVESVVEVYRDVTELRMAEEALRQSNLYLEHRVEERTSELAAANDTLSGEVVEHRRTASALAESEQRYRLLVDGSPDMVLVHKGGLIAFLNPPGARLLGFDSPEEALGMDVRELWESCDPEFPAEDIERALSTGEFDHPMPALLRRRDGHVVDVELTVGGLEYGGEHAIQCVVRDVTERVHAQRTIERMAYYDALTELPNRVLFRDRLQSALARARRRNELVAVVFVDLDDFKAINDSLGHIIGDGVLKAVARRLQALMREEDTIGRQSGDEFTIIARVETHDGARLLAERILDALRRSFTVDSYELHVSASVGVAVYPFDGAEELELMRNADVAMYQAKEWGRNVFRLYTPDMAASAIDRLELETGLRCALERDEFQLHYQPQIDLRTGRAVGVEALIRWRHPTQGLLLPGAFIELAEQAGFMGEIGHWILRTACLRAAAWEVERLEFGRVCVNLSAKEFVQQDVIANVRDVLAETGLAPEKLELEITESVAMHNIEQVLDVLGQLREMGVRVAIDDFGTGYSSMSYLKRFPIHTLKIAQDFMRDVHVNAQSAAIAGMVIDLCHELDLDIVAEGVEHESQLDFLESRGCYVIQGYLFSRPLPEDDLIGILRRGVPVRQLQPR